VLTKPEHCIIHPSNSIWPHLSTYDLVQEYNRKYQNISDGANVASRPKFPVSASSSSSCNAKVALVASLSVCCQSSKSRHYISLFS